MILSRFDIFHIMLGPARLKEFVDSDLKRQLHLFPGVLTNQSVVAITKKNNDADIKI